MKDSAYPQKRQGSQTRSPSQATQKLERPTAPFPTPRSWRRPLRRDNPEPPIQIPGHPVIVAILIIIIIINTITIAARAIPIRIDAGAVISLGRRPPRHTSARARPGWQRRHERCPDRDGLHRRPRSRRRLWCLRCSRRLGRLGRLGGTENRGLILSFWLSLLLLLRHGIQCRRTAATGVAPRPGDGDVLDDAVYLPLNVAHPHDAVARHGLLLARPRGAAQLRKRAALSSCCRC